MRKPTKRTILTAVCITIPIAAAAALLPKLIRYCRRKRYVTQ